ncbi:hypothetical protein Q0F99_11850 [Rathayibacter oskolensis]|uniref:hypothetical protein n=1 Tax=Rathayibacter oskolensis TaxID=1891671 RepID=UPI00265F7559|nr:hypothetical protein [Rathayibacter oskolensis]WKK70550.1 hypothetical protein Q0F99_11850 [Rathayibacter oskolensis]
MSDLTMNNTRGYLAEFLVARALGLNDVRRIEWEAYDLEFDGITIEVKSTAPLQAWPQAGYSRQVFSGLRTGPRGARTLNAAVYVFCAQTALKHSDYEPLDLSQWEVHVLSRRALEDAAVDSIGLTAVRALSGGATPWSEIRRAVVDAAQ